MAGALAFSPAREFRDREVRVWRFDLDAPPLPWAQLALVLSSDERDRLARYGHDRDRQRFAVGRAVLRVLLGRLLEREPGDLRFGYGDRGKPYLRDDPSWHFNLAHTENHALLAVARSPVGADIERVRSAAVESLARRMLLPWERERVLSLPSPERERVFFRYWTCKEACLKASGIGLVGARSLGICWQEPGAATTQPEGWYVRWRELEADLLAAIALGEGFPQCCWLGNWQSAGNG